MNRTNLTYSWKLNRNGIDGVDHSYFIAKNRLLEMRGRFYDWPLHLAGKIWIDLDTFEPVFRAALNRWHKGKYDPDVVDQSFAKARKEKEKDNRFDAFMAAKRPGKPGELLVMTGNELHDLIEEFDRLEASIHA